MPGPLSDIQSDQDIAPAGALTADLELHRTAAPVLKCVARDLRHRRRQPDLILAIHTERRREFARALPREHDVVLVTQVHCEERDRRFAHICRVAHRMGAVHIQFG